MLTPINRALGLDAGDLLLHFIEETDEYEVEEMA